MTNYPIALRRGTIDQLNTSIAALHPYEHVFATDTGKTYVVSDNNTKLLPQSGCQIEFYGYVDFVAKTEPQNKTADCQVLINGAGQGKFAGKNNQIAIYDGSSWSFTDITTDQDYVFITCGTALWLWNGKKWTEIIPELKLLPAVQAITATPPESPTEGMRVLISGSNATGDFEDCENQIACYISSNWEFVTEPDFEQRFLVTGPGNCVWHWNGHSWEEIAPGLKAGGGIIIDSDGTIRLNINESIFAIDSTTNQLQIAAIDGGAVAS